MGLVITGYCGVKKRKWSKKKTGYVQRKYIQQQHHDLDAVSGQKILRTETTRNHKGASGQNHSNKVSSKAPVFIKKCFWARWILALTPAITTAILLQTATCFSARELDLRTVSVQRTCKNKNNGSICDEEHKPLQSGFKNLCEWNWR